MYSLVKQRSNFISNQYWGKRKNPPSPLADTRHYASITSMKSSLISSKMSGSSSSSRATFPHTKVHVQRMCDSVCVLMTKRLETIWLFLQAPDFTSRRDPRGQSRLRGLKTNVVLTHPKRPPKTGLPNRGTKGTIRGHHHYSWTNPVTLLQGKPHISWTTAHSQRLEGYTRPSTLAQQCI